VYDQDIYEQALIDLRPIRPVAAGQAPVEDLDCVSFVFFPNPRNFRCFLDVLLRYPTYETSSTEVSGILT